jgi:enoyl-CoA hydratase
MARVPDALSPLEDIKSRSLAAARSLAAQPGFGAVKRQIRGPVAERVAALAVSGQDAFLGEFG